MIQSECKDMSHIAAHGGSAASAWRTARGFLATTARFLLGIGPLMGLSAPATGQDGRAANALAAAHAVYETMTTLEVTFVQTIDNPMLGGPETSGGTMYLFPPDRFSMQFDDPDGDRIVADGTWLWLATPSTTPDQVIRMPIPRVGAATPNIFSQFVDDPFTRYEVTYLGEDTASGQLVDRIRLVPLDPESPFRLATLSIDRANGLIKLLDMVELSGQNRSLVFGPVIRNQPIPSAVLMYRPGRGVRVVTP